MRLYNFFDGVSIAKMRSLFYNSGELITEGDWVKVYVPRLGVWHHGIVRSVYNAGPTGIGVGIAHNRKVFGVAATDRQEFCDGNPIVLHARAVSPAHVMGILMRVDANLGKPYHLFSQNCEHFASFAFTGKAQSESLQKAVGLAVAVGLASALFGG